MSRVLTGANGEEATDVVLDAQIQAKQLPPPPFKGMVKGAESGSTMYHVAQTTHACNTALNQMAHALL